MKLLTREGYEKAIDRYQSAQKARLLARYDVGHLHYGPLDLDAKDWVKEGREERDDSLAYDIFEMERLARAK